MKLDNPTTNGIGMLRLMFVTSSLTPGGAERQTVNLMNRLVERGHECHAVYVKSADHGQIDRIRVRGGGTVLGLDAARYFDRHALRRFAAHISRVAPSVIVAVNPYALMYSRLALRRAGVPASVAVTIHMTMLQSAKEHLQMLLYRLFLWSADALIFVCDKQRRYWLRRGVVSRRNRVIYNGVDTNEFCDRWGPQERAALRKALGFSQGDYVIGISAWLRPEKNHVQMVDAVAALRARGIPARVLMIGEGELRGAVEARARELDVEDSVVITGFQEDVRPYVAACDVMALCSFTEAFSLAAIEAMALSRPVVHSDVGGASESIMPGRNGFLFPAGDTGTLVDKLAILADSAVSRRMGTHAREVVERLFSEQVMVDRYERTLAELCRTRSGGEAGAVRSDHGGRAGVVR